MNRLDYLDQRAEELKQLSRPLENVVDPDGTLRKRRREIDDAQLQTAAELQKLREDLERIERKQDESEMKQDEKDKKTHKLATKSYFISILAALFGFGSFAAAVIAIVLQQLQ